HPPASFAFSGEAVAPPAEANRVTAGARLEAAISLGWEPPTLTEDEGAAAAAQAGAMLERALDVRDPVGSYDTRPGLAASVGDEERLTGRVVVESPQGATRLLLGPFDTAYQFSRTLGFPAPEGAFRIAIYGTLRNAAGARDFVVRSPLLVGASKEDLQAEALRADLEKLIASACGQPEVARLSALAPLTIHIRATGPAGGDWWLALKAEDCESGAGSIESPDLTLTASAADFLSLARGETSPKVLWETGRLDIAGSDQTIARLIALFRNE
ncbi:MAG TPA: SCP2 sterol-binding domain-containing protein, partial [Armatimonadota bacterium]|nr:SCP2 sterol-binding domain-containing protein [Armatimonadota bacterium]